MQTSSNKNHFIYAGFFVRLAAYFIDLILVSALSLCVQLPLLIVKFAASDVDFLNHFLFQYSVYDVIDYLMATAYFVLLTYFCGGTVGKLLLKLRVVDVEGRKLSFLTVLIRETVGKYLSALIICIGYLLIGFDSRKQGLHDKISDSIVVYRHSMPEPEVQTGADNLGATGVRPVVVKPELAAQPEEEIQPAGEVQTEVVVQQAAELQPEVVAQQAAAAQPEEEI